MLLEGYGDFISDQIDAAQARIQSRVGEFLQLKTILVNLKQSADPNIASKGAALYARQLSLEGLLTINMAKIDKLKVTGLSIAALPDIASIANFASAMESQINDVQALDNQARGIPTTTRTAITSTLKPVILFLSAGVVGLIAYKALK